MAESKMEVEVSHHLKMTKSGQSCHAKRDKMCTRPGKCVPLTREVWDITAKWHKMAGPIFLSLNFRINFRQRK